MRGTPGAQAGRAAWESPIPGVEAQGSGAPDDVLQERPSQVRIPLQAAKFLWARLGATGWSSD